jgi:hypothetical protein
VICLQGGGGNKALEVLLPWKRQTRWNHVTLLCADNGKDVHGMLAHFHRYWDGETGQFTVCAHVEWVNGVTKPNSACGRLCVYLKMLSGQDSERPECTHKRMLVGHGAYINNGNSSSSSARFCKGMCN